MVKEANIGIDALVKKVQDYIDEMTDINEKEELIGWQPTEFPKLLDAQRNVKPYQQLWGLLRDFQNNQASWTKEKVVFKLDPEEIDRETKQMFSQSQKLINIFPKSNPTCHKLINEVAKDIVDF
jgi:dynein heavy chain